MNAIPLIKITEVREHELQSVLSPWMPDKKWTSFLDGIATDGILQPVIALPDGRVIDGKHRLRAARELGLAEIRVVYEDIPDEQVATYIEKTKLERDDLTKGQRACIVLNSDEAQKIAAEARDRQRNGGKFKVSPSGEKINTHLSLAKKAGIGGGSMSRIIEMRKKRTDLYDRVFSGECTIGRAYAEMKRDELGEETLPVEAKRRKLDSRLEEIEIEVRERESVSIAPVDGEPLSSAANSVIRARQQVYDAATTVMSIYRRVEEADGTARTDYFAQLDTLVEAALVTRSRYETDEENASIIDLCIELIRKLRG